MSGLPLRVAALDAIDTVTAYRLWRLRVQVFVVEQRCPYPELDGRDLEPGTRHVWVSDGEEPVAYLRVLEQPDGGLRVGRVAVAAGHRGRGLAERLMREALSLAGGRPVVLDAQSYLAAWYSRLGFVVTGPEFLDDGIPHVPMALPRPVS